VKLRLRDCTRSLSGFPTKPWKQPQQAGQAKKNEERPPAESVNYYSTGKRSESRSTRLCGGNHRIGSAAVVLWKMLGKDFPICWYATDSPMPRMSRITNSAANPWRRPLMVVAVDQRKKPMARIHVTSKRSISHPTGSWQSVLVNGSNLTYVRAGCYSLKLITTCELGVLRV
jgi:hypothetical protein